MQNAYFTEVNVSITIDRFEPYEDTGYWLYGDGMPGPWRAEKVICRVCEALWIAVWPDGREPLECPACGETQGDRFDA